MDQYIILKNDSLSMFFSDKSKFINFLVRPQQILTILIYL